MMNWNYTTLGQCAIINDLLYSSTEEWKPVNYLDTQNITDNIISEFQPFGSPSTLPQRARRKIKEGDIVYSTVRPNKRHFGVLEKIPENILVSTAFSVIRAREGIAITKYLYYYLTQKKIIDYLQAVAEQNTSAYPSIRPSDLEGLQLALPTIEEQKAISLFLDYLNNKCKLNRQMSKTLEDLVRTLFKSWFVDFDPVRAKIDGRWNPGQSLPGLPTELYDLFPDRLVPSELGEIPEWWQVHTVGDCATIKGGKQIKRTEFDDKADIPVFGGAGKMGYTNKYNADGYVITFGRVGAPGIFVAYRGKSWVNNNASQVIPFEHIPDEWLFLSLRELNIESIKKGSVQTYVSNRDMAAMKIVIPDKKTLLFFQQMILPIILRCEQIDDESATLIQIRDTLLPKLLSGEIRVDELDIEL